MSTPNPTDAFLRQLRECGLLTPAQLATLSAWVVETRADTNSLAKEVVRLGWLTVYQLREVYRGNAADLTIGPYRVLDLLGEGGMGRVFKAHHTRLGRDVALKVIRKEKLSNPTVVKRFHQEVRAAAHLQHPNVVLAFDADEADGVHFFSMELVDGTDLTKLVRQNGPMPVELACDAIRQGALGLQHAFEKGLVHRDIKPSNLIMTPRRHVKLLDLGLAMLHEPNLAGGENPNRVTQDGFVLGTPDFLAPEQAQNPGGVDVRADIYGLGATLFYLLTGKVPFEGATPTEKLLKHISEPPPSLLQHLPFSPPQLDAIIQWMMAKRPQDRPQVPDQVAAMLLPFCPTQSGPMPMPGSPLPFAQPAAIAVPPTMAPAYQPPQPIPAAYPQAVFPQAMPMPASAFAPEPAGAPAFAGFDANDDEDDDRDRDRRRRRNRKDDNADEDLDRPRSRHSGGIKVRAPRPRSSWPLYLFLSVGAVALLVFLVLGIAYFTKQSNDASRPFDESFTTPAGSTMVLIQPGTFRMGSDLGEEGRRDEEGPARDVKLTRHFYMSVTEITREQYGDSNLMTDTPSFVNKNLGRFGPKLPVDGVPWTSAELYCKKLTDRVNALSDKDKLKHGWRKGWAFRLPTEAEWEYCCRAGTRSSFGFGTKLMLEREAMFAWDPSDNYQTEKPEGRRKEPRDYQHPVVTVRPAESDPYADVLYRTPNAFGLIDMHGNLWEWCQDNYSPTLDPETIDPTGPATPDRANWKVLRGGSYLLPAAECRAASRKGAAAGERARDIGFRIVYAPSKD